MAVKHGKVELTTTPADLTAEPDAPGDYQNVRTIRVHNSGASEVFLGDSTVSSTSYGVLLVSGAVISLDLRSDEKVYAVVAPVASPGVAAGTVILLHTGL